MPIFKIGKKIFYFAHVPKCGGSNVEVALMNSGVKLSFIDRQYWKKAPDKWGRSSPQHILSKQFYYLFDDKLFDEIFCVVRDPVNRFLSAYNHNRKRIGRNVSFDKFIKSIEKRKDYHSLKYDNHFVPASRIVPNNSKIFYLEDGLDSISYWLKEITDTDIDLSFDNRNTRDYNVHKSKKKINVFFKKNFFPQSPTLSDIGESEINRIKSLYQEDYERFDFQR